jgi:tol-pal system protein YbgF
MFVSAQHLKLPVALRAALMAIASFAACLPAHAALFDDDEARRQIAVERKRVDDLTQQAQQQQQAIAGRLDKIEEALKSQPILELFNQIQALKADLASLRGQIEVINNNIESSTRRQRDMYTDLDTRLRRLEQGTAPAAGGVSGSAPAAVPAAPAAKPAASPAATAAKPAATPTASAAAPAQSAAADPGEGAAYETAQNLRRSGDYKGAIAAFQEFLKRYPKSNLAPRASYWIGDSYFNLRDFKSSIASQQGLISAYPTSPSVSDAMLNIASSQIEMGDAGAGRKTLEELVAKFPVTDAAEKAKRRLSTLGASAAAK